MRTIILALVFVGMLVVLGCAANKSAAVSGPTQADVDRMQAAYPEYTLAELSQGKLLCEEKCSTCHGLKKATSRSAEQWKHIVPEMSEMANKKTIKISVKEQELILKYLVTMCDAK